MNKQYKVGNGNSAQPGSTLVRRVMIGSLVLLIVLVACSWCIYSWSFAQSVLLGGLLVNCSFWLLRMDAQRLMQRLGQTEGNVVSGFEKTRFFLRCYARLAVLGLLLFVLASQMTINVIGLVLGLTTVMFSVVIIGLSTGKCWLPSKA